MTRDFSKPLTILVSGSADSTTANINDNLLDWIFGGHDQRDVSVVIPYRSDMGEGMANFLVWGNEFFQWDQKDGDPLYAAVAPDGGHKSISHASKTWQAKNYREAMGWAVGQLTSAREDGHEIAVISFYNSEDENDLALITYAKELEIPTYDLAMSMVDNFPGYQTEEEKEAEAKSKAEFEKALAEVAAEEAPKEAPKPRKRAAKKTAAAKNPKTLEPADKPLQDVPEPTPEDPWNGVNRGFPQDANKPELSATVPVTHNGPNPHRAPLPGNPIHDQPVRTEEDIKARNAITVEKTDLVALAESMKKMGEAHAEGMATLIRIIEGA